MRVALLCCLFVGAAAGRKNPLGIQLPEGDKAAMHGEIERLRSALKKKEQENLALRNKLALTNSSFLARSNRTFMQMIVSEEKVVERTVIPPAMGFLLGFVASIPIAGPTSAVVFQHGLQGDFRGGLAVGVGAATGEGFYAGLAYFGFGSFLSKLDWLLPVSKVFGAIILLVLGTVFIRFDASSMTSSAPNLKKKLSTVQGDGDSAKAEAAYDANSLNLLQHPPYRKLLMGMMISGINPSLMMTYTTAIATVYGSGLLTFNFSLACLFGTGVMIGIASWFFTLMSILRKYKKRFKQRTIGKVLQVFGIFLFLLGVGLTVDAVDFFMTTAQKSAHVAANATMALELADAKNNVYEELAGGVAVVHTHTVQLHDFATESEDSKRLRGGAK